MGRAAAEQSKGTAAAFAAARRGPCRGAPPTPNRAARRARARSCAAAAASAVWRPSACAILPRSGSAHPPAAAERQA
eukprot:6197575-Pleurochrysis_carterae.AAC.1